MERVNYLQVNIPVLSELRAEVKVTAVNWLIGIDCIICLTNIPKLLAMTEVLQSTNLCAFRISFFLMTSYLKRFLSIGIGELIL